MNDDARLKLHEMITENNVQDNTDKIKHLKHSELIRKDVDTLLSIILKLKTDDYKTLDKACIQQCNFLFINYTNIYNKLLKNQIDIEILYKFLDCLKSIEDGIKNQHEGSYEIGLLLKSIYIDPKIYDEPIIRECKNISWNEYNNLHK
jgi:hypothetical protein